jgi:hypothetical protein
MSSETVITWFGPRDCRNDAAEAVGRIVGRSTRLGGSRLRAASANSAIEPTRRLGSPRHRHNLRLHCLTGAGRESSCISPSEPAWQPASASPGNVRRVPIRAQTLMTIEQAYETAYRFVWQYHRREVSSEPLLLMLVSMQPTPDHGRTNDPASWSDWEQCVAETLRGEPVPRFSSERSVEQQGQPTDAAD